MAKPGFAVICRWRPKPGEAQLHGTVDATPCSQLQRPGVAPPSRTGDVWYAYAQWPDSATRERAFAQDDQPEDRALMDDSIAERPSSIIVEPVADFLVLPQHRSQRGRLESCSRLS